VEDGRTLPRLDKNVVRVRMSTFYLPNQQLPKMRGRVPLGPASKLAADVHISGENALREGGMCGMLED